MRCTMIMFRLLLLCFFAITGRAAITHRVQGYCTAPFLQLFSTRPSSSHPTQHGLKLNKLRSCHCQRFLYCHSSEPSRVNIERKRRRNKSLKRNCNIQKDSDNVFSLLSLHSSDDKAETIIDKKAENDLTVCSNEATTTDILKGEAKQKSNFQNFGGIAKVVHEGANNIDSENGKKNKRQKLRKKSIQQQSMASLGDIMDGAFCSSGSKNEESSSPPAKQSSAVATTARLTSFDSFDSFQQYTEGRVGNQVQQEQNQHLLTFSSTMSTSSLAEMYGITNPLDRMALTANGNLQRLVSSYYDSPVSVVVDYCEQRKTTASIAKMTSTSISERVPISSSMKSKIRSSGTKVTTYHTAIGTSDRNSDRNSDSSTAYRCNGDSSSISGSSSSKLWDRKVRLLVHNRTFCYATSIITVHDEICQELVESGQIGLGQLFRYLDILPEFVLHDAGKITTSPSSKSETTALRSITESVNDVNDFGGGFWRDYTLQCSELSCRIYEEFLPNLWNIPNQ